MMLVLLPPSKTMDPGGDGPPWGPAAPLEEQRRRVAAAYERLAQDRSAFGQVVEASGDLLDDAVDQARGLRTDPTGAAAERYTGQLHLSVVYGGLDADGRAAYDRHVRILSGLLGLVAPDELVPRYRLPMGAELPGIGPLASFWREPLTAELARQAEGDLVWDLLSAEYRRAIDSDADVRMMQVRFERPAGDGWRAAPAVIGKQLKGALARHLSLSRSADRDPDGREAARRFRSQGFAFAEERDGKVPTVVYRPVG